jgi:hypothetical protein
MQPFIYATELVGVQSAINEKDMILFKPIFAMTLGGLKVLWAILFMQVLAHGATSSETLIINKTAVHFHFFRKWERKILGHDLVLGVAYCCLLIALVIICIRVESGLADLATALTIVCSFMALLDWFWKLWAKGTQNGAAISSKGRRPVLVDIERQPTINPYAASEARCNSELGNITAKTGSTSNRY